MPWGVFAGAWLFFTRWGAWKGWTRETQGALILVAGLGNTSFVGFPLVEALYGREALGTAVLLDQLGSFLALSTVGVAVASRYSTRSRTKSRGIGGLFRFPPFLALIAGFALRPVVFSESVVRVLERLALPLVPLALLAIGVQLGSRQSPDGRSRDGVSKVEWALGYKLLLAPLGIALLGSLAFRLSHRSGGMELCVGIIEAAMAPMITAAVVAEEFGLDPALGNRILAIGIPISLVTVPLWSVLLKALHLP